MSKRSIVLEVIAGALVLLAGVLSNVSTHLLDQTRDYLTGTPVTESDLASASTLLPIGSEVNYVAGLVNTTAMAVLVVTGVSLFLDLAQSRRVSSAATVVSPAAFVQRPLLRELARPATGDAGVINLSGVALGAIVAVTTLVLGLFVS